MRQFALWLPCLLALSGCAVHTTALKRTGAPYSEIKFSLEEQNHRQEQQDDADLLRERQEEELEEASRAIRLQPGSAIPYRWRGQLYLRMGRPRDALGDLDKALELSEDKYADTMARGTCLERLNRLPEAIEAYGQAIKLQPENREAYAKRFKLFIAEFRLEEARQDADRIEKLDPQRRSPQGGGGQLRAELDIAAGQYQDALHICQAYRNSMGVAYLQCKLGNLSQALQLLNRQLELHSDDSMACLLRGEALMRQGDLEHAAFDFEFALKSQQAGSRQGGELGLGRLDLEQGNLKAATERFSCVELDRLSAPQKAAYYLPYLRLLGEAGGDCRPLAAQAEGDFEARMREAPQDPTAPVDLALAYFLARIKPQEALELAGKAVELRPGADSFYARACCEFALKNFAAAVRDLEKAKRLDPSDTLTLEQLGKAEWALGDKPAARQAWEDGLKVNPKNRFLLADLGLLP